MLTSKLPPPFLLLFIMIIIINIMIINHANAYTFIYAGCSQQKYHPSTSPFEHNLNSLLTSVVSSSPQSLYNNFAFGNSTSTPDDSSIYGLYQCRGDLNPNTDCTRCIQTAVTQIGLVCPYSFGATLQLEGCYVRYEHFDFLGKPDLTLAYKRCSRSTTDDVEFFRSRDDVLADLQAGDGFRVSSSGSVQGVAQCLGDLSQADCSACLAEAARELKTLCGSAAAAHVFLANCYAQYWQAGYYDLTTGASDPTREDEFGKTVAIIVGIIGGIAVLIVLLSLCRGRATSGGKK